MSIQLVQYILTILGLSLSAFGAVVVLAADWSTMEDIVYRIGKRESILHHIPIIGYPFRRAKDFAHLNIAYKSLFQDNHEIDETERGFSLIVNIIKDISEKEKWQNWVERHNIESTDVREVVLNDSTANPEAGQTLAYNMYSNLYDVHGDSKGWVRTEVLRQAVLSRLDDLVSKSGASLFAGGFLLQLIAELLAMPEYIQVEASPVLLTVVALLLVLSIPGLCEQVNGRRTEQ